MIKLTYCRKSCLLTFITLISTFTEFRPLPILYCSGPCHRFLPKCVPYRCCPSKMHCKLILRFDKIFLQLGSVLLEAQSALRTITDNWILDLRHCLNAVIPTILVITATTILIHPSMMADSWKLPRSRLRSRVEVVVQPSTSQCLSSDQAQQSRRKPVRTVAMHYQLQ